MYIDYNEFKMGVFHLASKTQDHEDNEKWVVSDNNSNFIRLCTGKPYIDQGSYVN